MTNHIFATLLAASCAFVSLSASAETMHPTTYGESDNTPVEHLSDSSPHPAPSAPGLAVYSEASLSSEAGQRLFIEQEIDFLRSKSRRQFGGAIAAYSLSAASLAGSIYYLSIRCGEPSGFSNIFCNIGRAADAGSLLSISLGLTAGLAIPLHRASLFHRRAASHLGSDTSYSYSRDLHRAALMQRSARSSFITTGAFSAIALGAGIAAIASKNKESDGPVVSAPLALGAVAGVLGSAVVGTSLHIRGRNLERRGGESSSVQTIITPTFYGDGAGLSLFMGF